MGIYLDANAIVPLLYGEARSALMLELSRRDDLAASELAVGEACTALARRVRERELPPELFERRMLELDRYRKLWSRCEVLDDDLRVATTLVRRLELGVRMPDAIHLACCARSGLTMLSFDDGLLRAAGMLGVPVFRSTA